MVLNKDGISNEWMEQKSLLLQKVKSFNEIGDVIQNERNTVKKIEINGRFLNIKRFRKPSLFNAIIYRYFRQSKAERSFLYAQKLTSLGIGTPEPVAFFEFGRPGMLGYSFYLSKQSQYDFTYREIKVEGKVQNREAVLKAYTRFIWNMHENNVLFLDNSPGNTLITQEGDNLNFEIVDLNRMKFKKLTMQERLKNFERLSTQKWMYEIMGAEYAILCNLNKEDVIANMWGYVQDFQRGFKRKKKYKAKYKDFFKS